MVILFLTIKQLDKVYLIGCGRNAAEVNQYINDHGKYAVGGYIVDDNYITATEKTDQPIFSLTNFLIATPPQASIYLLNAIGDPKRQDIIEKLTAAGYQFINLVHTHSYISNALTIGIGNCIAPFSVVNFNVTIGNHCIINTSCSISHDSVLEDYVTLSPGVKIAGNVRIGKGVFMGIAAAVIPNITIGEGAYIAAGACVTKDVAPYTLVGGVPAKLIKKLSF
ncbi:MAG: acetyltransferase [Pedobacter sp.]|nr:MAG: acetyltransferase [Pedobacter sp.]